MTNLESAVKQPWRIVSASVRGASHERTGLPNQDAIRGLVTGIDCPCAVLAVSDGHGSNKCFRSDQGANFAVEIGTKAIATLVNRAFSLPTLTTIKRIAEENWPNEIARLWVEQVNQTLITDPITEYELAKLELNDGANARLAVEKNPLIAYGATILTVVATDEYIIYLQLGDGDILTVSDAGEVSRPMLADSRLFANETTSLCSKNAWKDFRFTFQVSNGQPPALILCSTDGYAGSFRTETDFLKVGSDLLELIRVDGLGTVESRLPDWLNEASLLGSGDDITLGLMYRSDINLTRHSLQDRRGATINNTYPGDNLNTLSDGSFADREVLTNEGQAKAEAMNGSSS